MILSYQYIDRIEFGPGQSKAYEYGSWAHAYLSNNVERRVLPESFFKTEQLQLQGLFSSTLWVASDEFPGLQIDEQLRIPL